MSQYYERVTEGERARRLRVFNDPKFGTDGERADALGMSLGGFEKWRLKEGLSKRRSDEQWAALVREAVERRGNGESTDDVARVLGVPRGTLVKAMLRAGYKFERKHRTKPSVRVPQARPNACESGASFTYPEQWCTEEVLQDLQRRERAGESRSAMARELGVNYQVIGSAYARMKKGGALGPVRSNPRSNKYLVREDYFDVIDTEEKAYVLGMLAADGSVHANGVRLSQSVDHADVVERVRDGLSPGRPLKRRPARVGKGTRGEPIQIQEQVILDMTSDKLATRLRALGLTENKTYELVFPPARFRSGGVLPRGEGTWTETDG